MSKIVISLIILISMVDTSKATGVNLNTIPVGDTITVSNDIFLIKISNEAYIHLTYMNSEKWGRYDSNGLLLIQDKEAFLFDSPSNDALTATLFNWLNDSAQIKITGFVPNHWHEDCMGGLSFLQKQLVKTYGNQITIELAKINQLPVPENSFNDSLKLKFGQQDIEFYYPGAAHTSDNIVVYLPQLKILFAGCMVKSLASKNLGNTADGDLKAYPATIKWLADKFQDVKIVIPGHGKFGGSELIEHTLSLSTK